jgi:tetrahedral aminopeptidase
VAAHQICPNVAFIMEGTIADDLPRDDEEEDISRTTIPGDGPALSVMDRSAIYDRRLNDLLMRAGDEEGIPYQVKQPGVGGTDGGQISRVFTGVPVAVVSTPCRYIHSPSAMLNKKDYQNAAALMSAALARLDRDVLAR